MSGIDVSHWQGNFNFCVAKFNFGVKFAIIKAGGSANGDCYIDERFEQFYKDAKNDNLHVGAYWYTTATTIDDAKFEARYLHNYCLKGKQFDMPIFLDVEDAKILVLGKRKLTDIVKAFCSELEKLGYFVGIYSSLSYYRNYMFDNELTRYAHWVAQWEASKCAYENESCLGIWQDSSSRYIAGVRCDTDICYVDYPKIINEKRLNGYCGKYDVNCDGVVNSKDIVAEQKAISEGKTDSKYDINGDGKVNSKDIVNLMKEVSK